MPTLITAQRYNQLQARVAEILGNGSGTSGYGQSTSSSPVVGKVGGQVTQSTDVVDADDMINLLQDMIKIRRHQIGPSAVVELEEVLAQVDVISEDTSPGSNKGIAQFETFQTTLETDKFLVDKATQTTNQFITTSQRTEIWNETVSHKFNIEFESGNRRRHFFNAGGEILITPELDISGVSNPNLKTTTWATMLGNVGIVSMNHTRTTTTFPLDATITVAEIGNYDLTSEFQTIFEKTITGTYADIDYTIRAREVSDSVIEFDCQFNDDSEPTDFSTYILSTTSASVNEGSSFTITLQTTLLPIGTSVPYTITGVNSNDISGASLTGNFIINASGEGTQTFTIANDELTEGTETFNLTLDNGETSIQITVNDTSQGPIYNLSADKTNANEGDSVTFTVNTENVSNGTTLYYSITGTDAQDFADSANTGSFTINSSTGSFTKTLANDLTTEGLEVMSVRIRTGSPSGTVVAGPVEVAVNDTSLTPAPRIDSLVWTPTTGNIDTTSFTLDWTTSFGNSLTYEITGPGTSISDSAATSDSSIALTFDTAGTYTGSISVTGIGGTTTDSVSLEVLGTPAYSVSAPASVNEGSNVTFSISTTNVVPGTVLYYTTSGINSSDLSNGSTSGSFEINALGNGTVTLGIRADSSTEGAETLNFSVRTGSTGGIEVANTAVTINDTSQDPPPQPTYSVTRILGSGNTVGEDSSIAWRLDTTNVSNGTRIYWTVSGISSSDIFDADSDFVASNNLSGYTEISNGQGAVLFMFAEDENTEGNETMTIRFRTGSTSGPTVASATVTLVDTSQAPPPPPPLNIEFALVAGGGASGQLVNPISQKVRAPGAGAGGEYAQGTVTLQLGESLTVVVGAGGSNGGKGGDTSIRRGGGTLANGTGGGAGASVIGDIVFPAPATGGGGAGAAIITAYPFAPVTGTAGSGRSGGGNAVLAGVGNGASQGRGFQTGSAAGAGGNGQDGAVDFSPPDSSPGVENNWFGQGGAEVGQGGYGWVYFHDTASGLQVFRGDFRNAFNNAGNGGSYGPRGDDESGPVSIPGINGGVTIRYPGTVKKGTGGAEGTANGYYFHVFGAGSGTFTYTG